MQVPDIAWFARQREALGLEATVYAFMAVGSTCPFPFTLSYDLAEFLPFSSS